jgi:Protein of unknown function (DUF3467)
MYFRFPLTHDLQSKEENIVAVREGEDVHFLPIEWHFPEHITSRYATNLVVQHTEHEFTISFFELHPPLLLGSPEERKAQLEHIKSVRAECVARIIVAAERMPEFLKVLQGQLEAYQTSREQGRTRLGQSE